MTARKLGESFFDYQERRKLENAQIKEKLKGKLVYSSETHMKKVGKKLVGVPYVAGIEQEIKKVKV